MSLITNSSKKYLSMFAGIEAKQNYKVIDHTGAEVTMTGKELKTYIIAHSRFIDFQPEQQVSDLSKSANLNKN